MLHNNRKQRVFEISQLVKKYHRSAEYLKSAIDIPIDFSFTAGSGLSGLSDSFELVKIIQYKSIPDFPQSTISGHFGELRIIRHKGKTCLYFAGRVHLYEGNSPEDIFFNVVSSHLLGCERIVISNAVGGLNPHYTCGDIMLVREMINMQNIEIVDSLNSMSLQPNLSLSLRSIADSNLSKYADSLCRKGISVKQGCLMAVTGPSYETSAEIRAFRKLGADAVGMSTVLELKAAKLLGIEAIGISFVSNELKEVSTSALEHSHVVNAAKAAENNLKLVLEMLFELN